jgi:enamine deaminase RidA (YjgF/YER057c/UK114 family)
MNPQLLIDLSALAASFLFIYGLKRMSSPVTARSGIVVAGVGMLVAVFGEKVRHARAAVGVNALPAGAPVEIELIAEIATP